MAGCRLKYEPYTNSLYKIFYRNFKGFIEKRNSLDILQALSIGCGPPSQRLMSSSSLRAPWCASSIKGKTKVIKDKKGRRTIAEAAGATPNIPYKVYHGCTICFSGFLSREHNAIERIFCRLEDFRRIATRIDRLAATVNHW